MQAQMLDRNGEVVALAEGEQRLLLGPWHCFQGVEQRLLIRDEATLMRALAPHLQQDASRARLKAWYDRVLCSSDNWQHTTEQVSSRMMGLMRSGAIAAVVVPASAGGDGAVPSAANPSSMAASVGPVTQWPLEARFRYVLEQTPGHLGPEAREAAADLLRPENLAIMVGVLVVWAGSHAIGVGFIADVALIGIGFALVGWAIFDGLKHLAEFFRLTIDAGSREDLEQAAEQLAACAAQIGIASLVALLTRGSSRLMRRGAREPRPDVQDAAPRRTPARQPERIAPAPQARFGHAAHNNYRRTFFDANPDLEGQVVVHHAVEQQVLKRYPGVATPNEIHSLENLRGIPNAANSDLHLSRIRREWNRFYRQTPSPTKQQLLDKATEIDRLFGSEFKPPIGP